MGDRLDFEIDAVLETGLITGHAGVPGLIEAFRQTGTAAMIAFGHLRGAQTPLAALQLDLAVDATVIACGQTRGQARL
jgi:hypothetical protein